ncbi:hypothetical protein VaNZ11_016612 [Volvox africanus]|uniref:Protein kinase domain-containing protein n=1 Tax=Volvox africanus TaxID=51714 RepID=A0ABQ5SNW6_9CHLO|nr:hypothetical protein VaNZ11_016612 [Volvox africanus]
MPLSQDERQGLSRECPSQPAMNSRTSASSDTFPSLSSGIGADGMGLRQFESSLDRIVNGGRSQERADPDTHVVAYNGRFQFFHTKRSSTMNEPVVNDLATREDSLVKAWRTVSEIDALLGSDFRPSVPSCGEERPSPVDEAYVKRLNSELEAAMNVSLTFKERYRAGRVGTRNGGGGGGGGGSWLGFVGVGGSAETWEQGHAAASSTATAGNKAATGEAQADVGQGTPHGATPVSHFHISNPSPRQRHSDASGIASPHSPLYNQQTQYQHQLQPHTLAPNSPRLSPRMVTSGGGGMLTVPSPPPTSSQAGAMTSTCASTSTKISNGSGVSVPVMATATFTVTGLEPAGGNKCLPSYSSVHIPMPPGWQGPPPSPRSVQMCGASTSASTGSAAAPSLLPPSASAPPSAVALLAAAVPHPLRRLHGGGIRVAVGSALDHGLWDSDGVWRPADPVHEVYIPQNLQRINADDLVKVRELGRGCFGSVWLAKWRGVEVALKELLNQTSLDGPPNEVFYEAERLASLRHPCVIAFYGIVATPGCYATVVEYMKMGSLKSGLSRLRKQGANISRRLRAAIALQAARGMEYLHNQYLVHFDLKCDNLLCDLRDPARPIVKIGDLGLSKKKKDSFVSGNMRGTLPWMAPELFPGVRGKQRQEAAAGAAVACDHAGVVIATAAVAANLGSGGGSIDGGGLDGDVNGVTDIAAITTVTVASNNNIFHNNGNTDCLDDRVNEKVDVFSFAIVLWEIWQLGEQPYSSYSLADIFAGVMTGSLRPDLPSDCDPDWATLMKACWHGNPRARPSFGEVAERLEDILERLTKQEIAATATNVGGDHFGGGGGGLPGPGSRRF